MAILINEKSRIIIQGITGNAGRGFAKTLSRRSNPLVGGVTPGKGGERVEGLPVFDFVADVVKELNANASYVVVGGAYVKDAVYEAVDAGIKLIDIYAEHVPIHDAIDSIAYCRSHGARLIGPAAAGVVSPGKANFSDINFDTIIPGRIGIASKSGTLTYEVMDGLHNRGMGESTVCCLGGEMIIGTGYRDVLQLFRDDPDTDAVVMLGEIGGMAELEAIDIVRHFGKPIVAYIAGRFAPPGKKMGHAGAITSGGKDGAGEKLRILREAGAIMAPLLTDIPELVAAAL